MKFVSTHLTRHHILHAPHRWFLAFLLSPLHLAETHYQNKYHLNFRHAKKLFIFDLLLLLSTVVIAVAGLWWYRYDPTVLDLVHIEVSPSKDKIASGETVNYTFRYINQSDAALESARLSIQLPPGFIIQTATPAELFDSQNNSFQLPPLPSGGHGEVQLEGIFYDVPDVQNEITVRLSYRQLNREEHEIKVRRGLTTLRGSILSTTLNTSSAILGQGSTRLEIKLKNNGAYPVETIRLPLLQTDRLSLSGISVDKGAVDGSVWQVPTLASNEEAILVTTLNSRLPTEQNRAEISFTPSLLVRGREFPQVPAKQILTVVHPRSTVTGSWADQEAVAKPGSTKTFITTITNTGDVALSSLTVSLPLPGAIVDITSFANRNPGRLQNSVFTVQKNVAANLNELQPGQSTTLSFVVPIRTQPDGSDIKLTLTPEMTAEIPSVPDATYRHQGTGNTLAIGTTLTIHTESRYYTNEGDQLGRGPLPPQIGKETKYWLFLRLNNSSSAVRDILMTAQLAEGVVWTGRTSVSHGQDIVFDPTNKTLRWSLQTLAAKGIVGIYAEVSITPTNNQRGQIINLLQNIRFTAHDMFIDSSLEALGKNIDTGLPYDALGQSRGVRVE